MRQLRLIGLSSDGRSVVCVDDAGAEYALPADDRLRAALRRDRASLGQLEIQMDSALRPRDIQARIRAGDSPETVASLAGVAVEKIMPFCVPVIAERQHIADTAQRSHVRRKQTEGPARRLSEVVAERLRGRGIDPDSAEWDAWRRDDGRWTVRTTYRSGERERTGTFVFDLAGRYSVADDDEARWLTGEKQSSSHGPQPREAGRGGERRLAAVPDGDDLLSLPDDEGDEVDDLDAVMRAVDERNDSAAPASFATDDSAEAAARRTDDDSAEAAARRTDDSAEAAARRTDDSAEAAARRTDDEESESNDGEEGKSETPHRQPDGSVQEPSESAGPEDEQSSGPAEQETEQTPRKRRQRRASVPSWDEIMFGKDGSND